MSRNCVTVRKYDLKRFSFLECWYECVGGFLRKNIRGIKLALMTELSSSKKILVPKTHISLKNMKMFLFLYVSNEGEINVIVGCWSVEKMWEKKCVERKILRKMWRNIIEDWEAKKKMQRNMWRKSVMKYYWRLWGGKCHEICHKICNKYVTKICNEIWIGFGYFRWFVKKIMNTSKSRSDDAPRIYIYIYILNNMWLNILCNIQFYIIVNDLHIF